MKLTLQSSVILNLVRGLSAQLVLMGHLLSFYKVYGYNDVAPEFNIQNFGVTVFFILSGFLIAYSVNNKGASYGFKDFFIDRFSRIYVALLPALFVICIFDFCSGYISEAYTYDSYVTVPQFIGNILMLQDFPLTRYFSSHFNLPWLNITSLGSGRPLWTIAIEWWVYMFFGFLIYKKLTVRNFIFWAFLMIVPFYNIATGGSVLPLIWFCGALVFYLFKIQRNKVWSSWKFIFFFLLGAMARLYFNNFQVYDLTFALLLTFVFFFSIQEVQQNQHRYDFILKIKKPAEVLAGYSFSLYLLHYSVALFIINLDLGINSWAEMLMIFLISNAVAYVFATFTEFRYHAYRKMIKQKILTRTTNVFLRKEVKHVDEKLG
jgi:peptidoglycan/LPS O-acetylase OafA/YrhL